MAQLVQENNEQAFGLATLAEAYGIPINVYQMLLDYLQTLNIMFVLLIILELDSIIMKGMLLQESIQ